MVIETNITRAQVFISSGYPLVEQRLQKLDMHVANKSMKHTVFFSKNQHFSLNKTSWLTNLIIWAFQKVNDHWGASSASSALSVATSRLIVILIWVQDAILFCKICRGYSSAAPRNSLSSSLSYHNNCSHVIAAGLHCHSTWVIVSILAFLSRNAHCPL